MKLISCDKCYLVFDADRILDDSNDYMVMFHCPVCVNEITVYRVDYDDEGAK